MAIGIASLAAATAPGPARADEADPPGGMRAPAAELTGIAAAMRETFGDALHGPGAADAERSCRTDLDGARRCEARLGPFIISTASGLSGVRMRAGVSRAAGTTACAVLFAHALGISIEDVAADATRTFKEAWDAEGGRASTVRDGVRLQISLPDGACITRTL